MTGIVVGLWILVGDVVALAEIWIFLVFTCVLFLLVLSFHYTSNYRYTGERLQPTVLLAEDLLKVPDRENKVFAVFRRTKFEVVRADCGFFAQ